MLKSHKRFFFIPILVLSFLFTQYVFAATPGNSQPWDDSWNPEPFVTTPMITEGQHLAGDILTLAGSYNGGTIQFVCDINSGLYHMSYAFTLTAAYYEILGQGIQGDLIADVDAEGQGHDGLCGDFKGWTFHYSRDINVSALPNGNYVARITFDSSHDAANMSNPPWRRVMDIPFTINRSGTVCLVSNRDTHVDTSRTGGSGYADELTANVTTCHTGASLDTYTATGVSLAGYNGPTYTPSQTQSLSSDGQTITFNLTYTANGPNPPPTCTSGAPQSAITAATSGDFYVYAYGVQNATSVTFPTWSDINGQDDIEWATGENQGGGTWRGTVHFTTWPHPDFGQFSSHIYMSNGAYTNTYCGNANFTRDQAPIGYLDAVNCSIIGGWAFDPDTSGDSIQIRYYNGTAEPWTLLTTSTANGIRPDINTAFGISGNHGFTITTPSSLKDNNPHTVYVYGINTNPAGANALIGSGTLTCAPPVSTISLSASPNPVAYSTASTLTWSSTNTVADSCSFTVGAGSIVGSTTGLPVSGSRQTTNLTTATPYTISCTGLDSLPKTASVNVDVVGSTPIASSPTYSIPDYCSSGPGGYVAWSYYDPSGSPQSAYQIQITNTGNFNNPMYDSGKLNSTSHVFAIPNGILQFGLGYKARVMVWNSNDNPSLWSNPTNTFNTPNYAYPNVMFAWPPLPKPQQSVPIQFTDHTMFGGGNVNSREWSWNFGDGGTSTQQSPAHTYSAVGNYTISETVTDAANQTCTYSQSINVQKPIPVIKEVAPK